MGTLLRESGYHVRAPASFSSQGSMDDAKTPLLKKNGGGGDTGGAAPWATTADGEVIMDMDVKEILSNPDSVISIIEKFGVVKLGEFEIEDSIAIKAFKDRSLLTVGADSLQDFDWSSMWYKELDNHRQPGKLAETGWTEAVIVEAHVLAIRNAAGPSRKGLLRPILMRFEKKACPISVFGLPAVQAVLDYKWEAWAAFWLKFEFLMYIGWLMSYTIFVITFQREDLQNRKGFISIWNTGDLLSRTTVVLNFTSIAFMSPFLLIELNTIVSYRLQWLQLWNLLDVATYSIQIIACYVYCSGHWILEEWFCILLSLQCIFLYAKVQYFSRVFASAKSSLVDTLKVVIDDVKWFLLFILLTMFSFALAFYVIFRQEPDKIEFTPAWHSIVSMFTFMLGGFDFHVFFESKHAVIAIIFFAVYEFLMAIMALNLLIAIMTDSYSKVMENERLWNLCSKAQIIDELETTIPKWFVKKHNPAYVHILKLRPRHEIDMSSLMQRLDTTEDSLLSTTKEISVKTTELERNVMKRLDFLSKELELLDDKGKKEIGLSKFAPQSSR